MTPNEYQKLAVVTATNTIPELNDGMYELLDSAFEFCISSAEIQDMLKKKLFYGKKIDHNKFLDNCEYALSQAVDIEQLWLQKPSMSMEVFLSPEQAGVLHGALGVMTEAAELQSMVSNSIRDGKRFDMTNMKEELGDILWYVALIAESTGIQLEDVMKLNIDKLRVRYGEKFTNAAAINRNIALEIATIEENK